MTDALANNIDNIINNISYNEGSKNSKMHTDGTFSNLMNTIDAKLKKTQTKFVDKAVKSNTSSINKFVLKKPETKPSNENQADINTQKAAKISSKEVSQNIETNKADISKNEIPIKKQTDKEIKEETNFSSDINDNSPVDPSPVFSLDDTDNNSKEIEPSPDKNNELEDAIKSVLAVLNFEKTEDSDTKIDDFEAQIENLDEIINTIDDISSMLDNSDLSQDKKDKLSMALDKIKTKVKEAKNDFSALDKTADEAEKIANDFLLKLFQETSQEKATEITGQTGIISSNSSSEFQDAINKTEEIISKISCAIDKNDKETLAKISENLDEITDKIDNLFTKPLADKKEEISELDKKLIQALKDTAQNLESSEQDKISLDLDELSELTESSNPDLEIINKELAQKIDKINFNNLEKTDKKLLADAIKTFEDINSTDDVEIKADDIIKKINNSKDNKETNIEDINIETDTASNSRENGQESKNSDLEKDNFADKMNEDILVDIKYQNIPEEEAALSVSDEVIKLSMKEQQSSLNSNTAIGNVTYDNSLIIKSAAQNIKMPSQLISEAEPTNDIFNQITNKITELKDGVQGQKLSMVLRPNDLGRLAIELTTTNQGLSANLMAQNDDVRNYIEKNINALRQQLADAGVNVNNIQIKTAGQEGSSNYDGNKNLAQDNEQNSQNQNNQQENKNQHNQKEAKETLLSMSDYETRFAKDFSSVLNKSINYSLN